MYDTHTNTVTFSEVSLKAQFTKVKKSNKKKKKLSSISETESDDINKKEHVQYFDTPAANILST